MSRTGSDPALRACRCLSTAILLTVLGWPAPGLGQGVSTTISSGVSPASLEKEGEPIHTDVRASSFQRVTPGKTTFDQLLETQGEPLEEFAEGNSRILVYELGPFPKVEVILAGDLVDSVVVHLERPAAPDAIAKELGLTSFTPAPIHDDLGNTLGQVYPERAVAFSFEGNGPPQVSQLVLEPISPEFFLLRAKNDRHRHYSRTIADLNYVLKSDPSNATALYLKAAVYQAVGHNRSALRAIEMALSEKPQDANFRLLRAAVKFELGQYRSALVETKSVLEETTTEMVQGRGEALLGDLLAKGPERDYQTALKHHQAAVKYVAPLASNRQILVRREAKRLLVEVHLAIANDITHGKWSGKEESAPKWLRIAKELTDQLIEQDRGDETVRLLLLHGALASYVGMRGLVDPTDVIQQAVEKGEKMLAESKDPLRDRELRWLLVRSLVEGVRVEQMRGEGENVIDYAAKIDSHLRHLEPEEESTARVDEVRGQVYFLVGSTFAVQLNDHATAIRWYERSLPYLTKARPASASADLVRHGQRFVSMGVSYWDQNARNEAVRLTESGLKIMQTAIEAGELEAAPLAVPFSNLSAMYSDLGRGDEAQLLAAKAARLESGSTQSR